MGRIFLMFLAAALSTAALSAPPEAAFIGAGAESGAHPCLVRREVTNPAAVAKAIWRVTGLGVINPAVNGRRALPAEVLAPGYTHFTRRRHEIATDVTPLWDCAPGATNVLSALVTPGWWCDGIAGKSGGTWPAFRAILELEFSDGSSATIPTDSSWLVSTDTPNVSAGIWEGATFDARIEPREWRPAAVSTEFTGEISPRVGPPVVLRDDLAMAGGDFKVDKGVTNIIDFGQNCAALPLLRIRAPKGVKVVCRFGEMLNDGIKGHHCDGPAGSVYLANMRGAKAGFDYISAGQTGSGDFATYMPQGTFFGYRYASITADGPAEGSISSIPVTSISKEMERGSLVTGRDDINRLVQNAWWGMLSNYLSVPTDCPQRNERLGWTGDTQVFAKTATYFADIASFMRKWMQDVRDTQRQDGIVPDVAPLGPFGGDGPNAGWSDAAVIVPYTIWKYLGDEQIVRENWHAMAKFVAAIAKNDYTTKRGKWLTCDWLSFEKLSVDNTLRWSKGTLTGDHLEYQNFLNACHLLLDVVMMRELSARISGLGPAEGLDLPALESRTRERILKRWFKPDGTLAELFEGMQTPALFALRLGLGDKDKLSAALAAAIHANGERLATGFLGTPLLCDVLSDNGMSRLAYSILLQDEFPSWLYSVRQGATTIWERWNGYTKAAGFGPVSMNSFNHYSYGAVVGWLFEHAAGLKPSSGGGWRNFTVQPEPDERLGFIDARLKTPEGEIKSSWKYAPDGSCQIEIVVPPSCTATLILPDSTSHRLQSGSHFFSLPPA